MIGSAKPAEFQALIGDADRLRDSRHYAAAAEAYGAALALMPERTDIRVQYANMLKDSGRFAEAEAAYRQALAEMPDDTDAHLQLGHALKLQGKRAEALASYRRSAALQPDNTDALKELFFAGAFDEQLQLFERRLAIGDIDAMLSLREEIARLQEMLQRLTAKLPDLQAQTSFPFAGYDRFRRLYDVPPAPAPLRPRHFAVIMPTSDSALDIFYAQHAAMRAQTAADWRLYVLGSDDAHRRIVERASDPRLAWIEAAPDEKLADVERRIAPSLEADWLLLLAEGALPHRRALEWFAAIVTRCSAAAYVTDAETIASEDDVTRRSAPVLRQVVDFDTLLEANPFGETIAVELTAYMQLADKLVTGAIASARASLLLHLAEHNRVGHIPLPLLARDVTCPTEPPAVAHEAAVRAYLAAAADQCPATVGAPDSPGKSLAIRWRPRNEREPLVVIVPTRDNGADLGNFVKSLRGRAERPDALSVVVVDNGSRDL
ncbi:MAG: tetratricopeptide repeat protein, partial [Alphaproteobacteria bacterium]|nr:tetratricopeptide repeat protein [Alphaproteobacteria bacterium]